jgi:hypothetical protein
MRVFARIGFAAVIAAGVAIAFVMWRRHTPVALLHGLIVLPAVLWGIHRSWHASRGTTLIHPYWPFATQHVAMGYWFTSTAIALFASRLYQ